MDVKERLIQLYVNARSLFKTNIWCCADCAGCVPGCKNQGANWSFVSGIRNAECHLPAAEPESIPNNNDNNRDRDRCG